MKLVRMKFGPPISVAQISSISVLIVPKLKLNTVKTDKIGTVEIWLTIGQLKISSVPFFLHRTKNCAWCKWGYSLKYRSLALFLKHQ